LRVLQEQEFERIGSNRTIRVDVRIIAATNQNLAELVNQRRFRPDLFYRLNVFPIRLPPLRDRLDDISSLARHFAARFSKQMHKEVNCIPDSVIDVLRRHDWPGNIRELQNVIERAVILSPGPVLRLPLEELHVERAVIRSSGPMLRLPLEAPIALAETLANREREMITAALAASRGRISGPSGAAGKLGMPRTTLESKIKNLRIDKHRFECAYSSNPQREPGEETHQYAKCNGV
jgi:formate hydrogenlyase transcriptional activator